MAAVDVGFNNHPTIFSGTIAINLIQIIIGVFLA
jgi:hypothetical protein